MAGWHHQLDGYEFEWTPGVADGQGGLECCSPWGHKSQAWLSNWTELNWTDTNTWWNRDGKWIKGNKIKIEIFKGRNSCGQHLSKSESPISSGKTMLGLCAELLQSCPNLCDPRDHNPPGSSVHGMLQARALEGLPCPPPGDLPNPGIEPTSHWRAGSSLAPPGKQGCTWSIENDGVVRPPFTPLRRLTGNKSTLKL